MVISDRKRESRVTMSRLYLQSGAAPVGNYGQLLWINSIKLCFIDVDTRPTPSHQRTLRAAVFRNKAVRSQLAVKATDRVIRNLRAAGNGFVRR